MKEERSWRYDDKKVYFNNLVQTEQIGVFNIALKLAKMGWTVHTTSFQSSIDLIIEKHNIVRTIQVKSSHKKFIKNKRGGRIKKGFWHFYRKGTFYDTYSKIIDFLILVALDDVNGEVIAKKVMIFPKEDLPKTKGVQMFENHTNHETHFPKKYLKFENAWNLIK